MTDTLVNDLRYYQSKRRFPHWQPKSSGSVRQPDLSTGEQIVKRCLAFLPLEITVGQWVTNDSKQNAEVDAICFRNAEDEQKHDQALADLSTHYGGASADIRSNSFVEQWRTNDAPAIVKAYALEMGVFFSILPALIRYGDTYASTVSTWISDDERVHVETNLRLMKASKLKLTAELVQLVFATVAWIFLPLGEAEAEAQGRRAIKRLTTGKDPAMLGESLPVTIAYFEQKNKQAIVY